MKPFLKTVAEAYLSRYSDLSEMCFVFPNKRSGTFFLKYLLDVCGQNVIVAPEITSISEFMEKMSGRLITSNLDLLFRLFNIYKELAEEEPEYIKRFGAPEFENFRNWGEVVLSDFDEVDAYCVDHSEIFRNLKDFKNISSNYLTEEQLRVLEEYFGTTPGRQSVDEFWSNLDYGDSEIKRRFLYLWEVLSPLYERLHASLDREGLATEGGAYRLAAQRMAETESQELPWKKVVLIGFNALSTSEANVFKSLRDMEPRIEGDTAYADFLWDGTGPVLTDSDNNASEFLTSNRKNFPSPEWVRQFVAESDTATLPESMKIISSPSKVVQTKIVGNLLETLKNRLDKESFTDARVAVVLPDETLLLPMLYSLPEGLENVNLTMGYPLKLTSTVSFVNHLRQLQTRLRHSEEEVMFYVSDLKLFLGHPFAHIVMGSLAVAKINFYINDSHKNLISLTEIRRFSEKGAELIAPIDRKTDGQSVIREIDRRLGMVDESLPAEAGLMVKSRLDRDHIAVYRDALRVLSGAMQRHGVEMNFLSVFKLADRLISSCKVTFEGEPLEGLQVMGLLETRLLDFDYLIVPSVNEGTLPRRMRKKSFIPNSLRAGYGMPPSNYQESIFAYYFYRMISRTREVRFIYDARSGAGTGGNEMSRYLQQLRYLYAPGEIESEKQRFMLSKSGTFDSSVVKTLTVMARLGEFLNGGPKSLSHSAVRKYFECKVRFYYESIIGIKTDEKIYEYLTPVEQGQIVHSIMLELYLPEEKRGKLLDPPELILPSRLDAILSDREDIERRVERLINEEHFKLPDEKLDREIPLGMKMMVPFLAERVMGIVAYDRTLAPFSLLGCEVAFETGWPIEGGTVNFRFVADRIDRVMIGGEERMRIIDYKTGNVKVDADSLEGVFEYDTDRKEADSRFDHGVQLLTYSALMEMRDENAPDYQLAIYGTDEMEQGAREIKLKNEPAEGVKPAFVRLYTRMLEEIFDSSEGFDMPESEAECEYCRLRQLCGRQKA